jgi:hypothetical protein
MSNRHYCIFYGDTQWNFGVSPTHPMHIPKRTKNQNPVLPTYGTFARNLTPEKGKSTPMQSYIKANHIFFLHLNQCR